MTQSRDASDPTTSTLLWLARLGGAAAIVPLMLIVFGESGTGPAGVREWVYLALFPFGFSAGYLLGWKWPLLGGRVSLACMALSLVVAGRLFGLQAYAIWAVLSVPGVLYLLAGSKLRAAAAHGRPPQTL